jgi:hypothetical protein
VSWGVTDEDEDDDVVFPLAKGLTSVFPLAKGLAANRFSAAEAAFARFCAR